MSLRKCVAILISLVVLASLAMAEGQQEGSEEGGEKAITLVGATMVPQDHIYTQAMRKFGDLVQEYYSGELKIDVHHSGDLGGEKDFFEYMKKGTAVDYAIVSPGWIANWSDQFAFLDTPFLWKGMDHWRAGINSEAFSPLESDVRSEGVMILGYAGGGRRNLILSKKVDSFEELPKVKMRVQGSPIQARVFNATGIQATPMDYNEVYNGIKTGVIDGLENEAASLITMKFYEVAPYVVQTEHTITIRPLCFSKKRFDSFNEDLQNAIRKAGEEAAAWAREMEVAKGPSTLDQLQSEDKITIIPFNEGAEKMREEAVPVIENFAGELGVSDVYENIKSVN